MSFYLNFSECRFTYFKRSRYKGSGSITGDGKIKEKSGAESRRPCPTKRRRASFGMTPSMPGKRNQQVMATARPPRVFRARKIYGERELINENRRHLHWLHFVMVKMPLVEPKSGGLVGDMRSCVANSRFWHLKDIWI